MAEENCNRVRQSNDASLRTLRNLRHSVDSVEEPSEYFVKIAKNPRDTSLIILVLRRCLCIRR